MDMHKDYIDLLKKFPRRIFSMEGPGIISKEESRTDAGNVSEEEKLKSVNEWIQEYELIYNSYVLEG